ncbi:MAG: NYN domain-containing protein [Silanimonas sp.]
MSDTSPSIPRLAVLIDADNAQPSVIAPLLAEVGKFGSARVRRIYGNWTSPQHGEWKQALLEHSIQPVQQFAYTKGKNATDSALIIDAMDLLYTRRFDGFCLVSSDSDFTRLAQRIREEGLSVYGFGERKTPEPFVAACDKFIYTDLLRPRLPSKPAAAKPAAPKKATEAAPISKPVEPEKAPASVLVQPNEAAPAPIDAVALITQAIEEVEAEDGWAALAAVGSYLNTLRSDFDPRLFGHKKLSDVLKAHPRAFELRESSIAGTDAKVVHARLRGG